MVFQEWEWKKNSFEKQKHNLLKKIILIPSLNWLAFTRKFPVITFMRFKSCSICGKVSTNVAS